MGGWKVFWLANWNRPGARERFLEETLCGGAEDMGEESTSAGDVIHLKNCIVCEQPHGHRGETCSRRECLMVMAEFESFCTVRFITTNARWAGGNGCETAEELMAKAVRELPESSDLLGTLLIEIIEELENGAELQR
jgi:hypothetical protein